MMRYDGGSPAAPAPAGTTKLSDILRQVLDQDTANLVLQTLSAVAPMPTSVGPWLVRDAKDHLSRLLRSVRDNEPQIIQSGERGDPIMVITVKELAELLVRARQPMTLANAVRPSEDFPAIGERLTVPNVPPGAEPFVLRTASHKP